MPYKRNPFERNLVPPCAHQNRPTETILSCLALGFNMFSRRSRLAPPNPEVRTPLRLAYGRKMKKTRQKGAPRTAELGTYTPPRASRNTNRMKEKEQRKECFAAPDGPVGTQIQFKAKCRSIGERKIESTWKSCPAFCVYCEDWRELIKLFSTTTIMS